MTKKTVNWICDYGAGLRRGGYKYGWGQCTRGHLCAERKTRPNKDPRAKQRETARWGTASV